MRLGWSIVLLAIPLLAACKQQEGDRCNLDTDCEEGLVCCLVTGTFPVEGKCYPKGKCQLSTDAGVPDGRVDGSRADGIVDGKPGQEGKADGIRNDRQVVDTKLAADSKPTADSKPIVDSMPTADSKAAVDVHATDGPKE